MQILERSLLCPLSLAQLLNHVRFYALQLLNLRFDVRLRQLPPFLLQLRLLGEVVLHDLLLLLLEQLVLLFSLEK
jgi:hypothetical protein